MWRMELNLVLHRLHQLVSGYPELVAVLVAAVIGLTVQPPLAWLAAHQGINVLLAALVFATAVTIEPAALRRLIGSWRLLLAAVVTGVTVLPALSWAVSRFVAAGSLRNGVMTVGLAPCEIASVATTAMAGGEAALSAGVLIGSTIAAVAAQGRSSVWKSAMPRYTPDTSSSILPSSWRSLSPPDSVSGPSNPSEPEPNWPPPELPSCIVAALVALIAAEVHVSARYLAIGGALVVFIAGSAVIGRLARPRRTPAGTIAVLLTDFDA